MVDIKIKSESLAVRCEICHQSDCFSAEENFCSRCKIAEFTQEISSQQYLPRNNSYSIMNIAVYSLMGILYVIIGFVVRSNSSASFLLPFLISLLLSSYVINRSEVSTSYIGGIILGLISAIVCIISPDVYSSGMPHTTKVKLTQFLIIQTLISSIIGSLVMVYCQRKRKRR